jgi:transcriptional regulator with XRE-family HTH domain
MNKEQAAQRMGQRITTLRKLAGISQQELADRAGLTRQHIGRIEKGELVSVAYVTIQQIAEALGMTVDIVDERLQDLAPLKRLTPTAKDEHNEAVESKAIETFDFMKIAKLEMKNRMERNGNDIDKTAAEMGISKRTLNRELKKLGLI